MTAPRRPHLRGSLSRASLMVAAAMLGLAVSTAPKAQAANLYWDANGIDAGVGGTGNWDTSSAFWSTSAVGTDAVAIASFSSADIAYFTGTAGVVALAGPITIGGLVFDGADFTVTGDTLTLAAASGAPTISVTNGNVATLSSIVAGTSGLTKSGNGVLRLTNATNSYTGVTTISAGVLVISSGTALGSDASAISILTTNLVPSNTGLLGNGGGSLVLDGFVAGFALTRNIDFDGRGPFGDRSSAILSIGNNTLSGTLTSAVNALSPATPRNSRITSVNGTLTLSGTLISQGTTATTFLNLGGVNTAGVGNFNLTGILSGSGSIEKTGGGALFLNPSLATGFTGTVRVGGSATGAQSSILVTSTGVFGASTGTTTSSVIDLNGGTLEFRSDASLNFGALTGGKNVYNRSTGIIFAGSAAGGAAINGTVILGALQQNGSGTTATNTLTLSSRNGYGVTFSTFVSDAATGATVQSSTLTSNMGGNLTFTGNVTIPEGTTASRPRSLLIRGTGNTLIQGSIIGGTDVGKDLTKTDAGALTILGIASTGTGPVNISVGTIVATDFRSLLSNNTAAIVLGNATTTGGNLIIGTTSAATAPGLSTLKTITLNTTTGSNSIYASQALASPVILNGAITKIGASTTGSLILGGTSTQDNIITVGIPAGTTGGVTKLGVGTWVLSANNTYAGATTIQGGTLKLRATAAASDVIASAAGNTVVFSADSVTQTAGGTFEFKGFLNAITTETLGALTATNGVANIVTVANGGATTLTFSSLGTRTAGATINYDPGATSFIAFTSLPVVTNNIIAAASGAAAFQTYNEVDWAMLSGSNVAQYTGYTTTAIPVSGVTGAAINYSQSVSAATTGAASINTLKIVGGVSAPTITLGGILTLTAKGVLFDNSAGTATITGSQLGVAAVETVIITSGSTPANALTINSVIGSTTGSLTKSGDGTLIVGGNNTFTGNVTINQGTVRLSGATVNLGYNTTAANITTLRQGATLDINAAGVSQTIGVGALQGAGTVTNSGGGTSTAGTISFGGGASTGAGIFSGVLQDGAGILNVIFNGTTARTQALLGQSTYTGVTTIATGAQVTVNTLADGGSASGIGASSNAAANLVFSGTAPTLIYQGNNRVGSLNLGSNSVTTDRLFTISGAAAVLSSTVTNANAIIWSNIGAIAHGTVAARTLTLTGTSTGDNTFAPQLTDSGSGASITSLTKTAAGQWNLAGTSNSYTGATTVNEGILGLNAAGVLPSLSPLVLTPTSATSVAILQMSGEFTRSLATSAVAGSGTVTFGYSIASTTGGVGFAAHSTSLVVAIGGTVSPTALTWASGGFVGTGGGQNLALNSTSALSSVDFRNAIDLGAAVRTINVLDNTNTGADYATMSGVLSGASGGLLKIGAGVLQLTALNSYTGTTSVEAGTLVVSSLGGSTGAATTSVGAGAVAMGDSNAIVLGNATSGGGLLQYVGPGETSDRKIRLRGTTAGNQLHADGTGSLVLTNVVHDTTETGAKTLSLRGSSLFPNFITSQLSNNVAGVLSVTVDGGTAWVLTNPVNSYTGTTTVSGGALGIGHDTAIPAILNVTNGNVFAFGGDRTLTNTLTLATNASNGWIGDYSLTFNGANSLTGTTTSLSVTTTNSVASGKKVTFNGMTSAATANRTWTIGGSGETVIGGTFSTTTGSGVSIVVDGGFLNLGTNGATSDWNKAGNALDLDRGTLKFSANNAIPNRFVLVSTATSAGVATTAVIYTVGSTAGLLPGQSFTGTNVPAGSSILTIDSATSFTSTIAVGATPVASAATLTFAASVAGLTISPELLTTDTATVDLNGTTQTIDALTATSDGTVVINNTSSSAAAFRFGANDTAVTFGTGIGVYSIQNTGSGKLDIVKLGNSVVSFGASVPVGNKGIIASEGGSFTVAGDVTAASGLSATGNSTLALTGTLTNPGLITSVVVSGGSTLSLLNGTGTPLSLTNLSLGVGTGTATLSLNVGESATDTITLLTGGTKTLANTVTINMTDAGLAGSTTYTLLSLVDGGLTAFGAGNIIQGGTPGGFTSMTWGVTDTAVTLTTGTLITGALYWRGTADLTWNSNLNNWSLNKDGTGAPLSLPGAGTNVIFAWDGVAAAPLVTTLEQNYKINKLVFEAGTTTPTTVTINPGAVSTNRLEIAPQVSTDGIEMQSTGPAIVTFGANLRLGANQTWNVASSAGVLTLGGSLLGMANVNLSGAGKVTLSAAADPGFNAGDTATFTVAGGTLELTNAGALGTAAAGNAAALILSGGAFYYNNVVSATLANPITLSGGTLSLGGVAHTYSGPVTVQASTSSTVNLRGQNSAVTSTTQFNMDLLGVVSGTGALTLDSIDAIGSGNQVTGSFYIKNAASTWNGALNVTRGQAYFQNIAGTGTATAYFGFNGIINFNQFGRVTYRNVDGGAFTRTAAINFAAGALGEVAVDNVATTLAANYTLTQSGAVNLNAGSVVRFTLGDAASNIILTGGVVLNGAGSISVSGGDADSLVTISGTGISGTGNLAINDEALAWTTTSTLLAINAAGTYSGNTTLTEGTLILGHKNALSSGSLTILGASTIQASVNLSAGGSGPVPNALILNSSLTVAGTNSLTFGGAVSVTAAATLTLSGTANAITVFSGAITVSTVDIGLTLVGNATSSGVISGGITMPAGAASADLAVTSGTWTITGANSTIADDLLVNGGTVTLQDTVITLNDDIVVSNAGTVLNLNTTGVWAPVSAAVSSSNLYARGGAVVNFNANDVNGLSNANGLDAILAGDGTTLGIGTFNFNGTTQTIPAVNLGATTDGYSGVLAGPGTLIATYTGTDYASGFRFYRGAVSVNLSGGATILKQGLGDVTLSGDNSGLTGAVAANTRLDAGNLILDYTTSNTSKLPPSRSLDMRGAIVTITGNASAATSQTVAGLTLASGGSNRITVVAGSGQTAVLNLGAITRAASAGTLRVVLPLGTQDATNGVITTALANANGTLPGYLTVSDDTGIYFAGKNATNNLIKVASTTKTNVSTWTSVDNVDNVGGAFTGSVAALTSVNTLTFASASSNTVTIASGATLNIVSGGVLITSAVSAGTQTITGGRLTSGIAELIFTQEGAATLIVASVIGPSNGVTKTGNGTLRLANAANIFTGTVNIHAGILEVSGGNAIGDNAAVTLTNSALAPTLSLGASITETIGTLSGGGTNGGVISLGANAVLTVNQGAAGTYSGLITGDGTTTFVKTGSAILTLQSTANSGFTGTFRIDQGQVTISSSLLPLTAVTTIILNGPTSVLQNNQDQSTSQNRINNTAAIFLNNTAGGNGLSLTKSSTTGGLEVVGALTLGAGHNVITATSGVANAGQWTFASLDALNSNHATALVHGAALGSDVTISRGVIFLTAAPSGAYAAVGTTAGGIIGTTKNLQVIPYFVGDVTAAGLGNSFVTNNTTTYGLRPLAAAEYDQDVTTLVAGDNTRYTVSTAITSLATVSTINSLVLDAATAITLTASPTGTLTVSSGMILAAGAASHSIDASVTGLATSGASRDYAIFVTTAAGTLTIAAPLTTAAPLVKSGAGTLVLSSTSNAFTDVYFNQGALQVSNLSMLGAGTLKFFGGTLQLGAAAGGFTGDPSAKTITFGTGGGTFDTNGNDISLAGSLGSGTGSFTKSGNGTLTLNAASTYTGATNVSGGTLALGANNLTFGALTISGAATLAMGANNATVSTLTLSAGSANVISGSGTLTLTGDATLNQGTIAPVLAGSMNLFKSTASQTVTLSNTANTFTGYTYVQAGTLEISNVANAGTASSLGAPTGENAIIRLGNGTTTGTLLIVAAGTAGTTDRVISLDGSTGGGVIDNDGMAALILNGAIVGGEGGAKTLTLQGATTGFNNQAVGVISDGAATSLGLTKAEAGTWILLGGNTYTGTTTVSAGVLQIGNASTAGTLGTGAVAIASGASLILNRSDAFAVANIFSGLGTLTVTGANTYTLTGASTLTGGVVFSGSDIILGASQALGSLSGSSGNLALGSNVLTLSFAAGTSTYPGNISGTGSIIKTLAGTQVLTGTNNFSGGVTVTGGLISVSDDAKLGATSGPLVLNGGGLQVTGTTFTSWTNSSARTLTLSGATTFDIADQANTFTLGVSAITAAGAFTKSGLGRLVVTNALTMGANALNVTTGTLVLQNGFTNATGGSFRVGDSAGSNAAFVQTGGTTVLSQADGETILVGTGGNSFGSFTISGGTFQASRLQPTGTSGTNNSGLVTVLAGGTLRLTTYFIGGRSSSTNTGVVTIAGGALDVTAIGAANSGAYGGGRFEVNFGANLGGANTGGTFDAGTKTLYAVTNTTTSQGIINLLGGTLTVGSVSSLAASTFAQFNMNGGTLKAGAASVTFLSANLTAANVYSGGVTIDNNGFAITLAKSLTAPAGNGVASVSVIGASGYFTAPMVKLTGGGGNGDATAAAVLNEDGTISIVITNPGTGYTSAPSVILVGGTSGTAATASAELNSGNTSGGITFQGSSTTTLSTDNTYAGTTTIAAGTVVISSSGALGSTVGSTTVASGAALKLATANFTLAENLTLSGTGVGAAGNTYGALLFNNNTGNYTLSGLVTLSGDAAINSYAAGTTNVTFAQGIQGTGGLTLSASAANNGGAVYTLNGASTYTGDTTLSTNNASATLAPYNGIVLKNGVNNALPVATVLRLLATSGTPGTYGKYQLNGFNQEVAGLEGAVAANTLNSIVGGSATLSTLTVNNSSDYTFAGQLGNVGTSENNLALIKTGAGALTLSGANTFSRGTTITGGTLAFSAAGNLGDTSATNTISLNGGVLSFTDASAASLSANQVMTIGANGGTIDVAEASGSLALLGGITSSVAANLTKTGLGALTVTGTVELTGGNVTVSAGVLQAGFTASGVGAINVAAGATLNLYNGTATTMAITGLTLANGSTLGFDLNGSGVNDSLSLTGSAVIAPSVSLNFNNLGGLAAGTYDLLNVTSGTLTATDYVLGSAPSGLNYNFTTINSGQTLRLTTSLLNLVYWKGDVSGSWSANAASDTNWTSDLAGSTDLGALPVATDTLVFSSSGAVGTALVTTLDGDFTADSLRFTANPSGVTSLTINQGTSGTLTLSPASSNNGITVATNAGAITLGAPVATGAIQTWEIVGGGANGSSLTVSGAVAIGHLINKTGAGSLTLSGSNTGAGGINLVAGSLVIGNDSALGTGTFSIGADTIIDTGAGAIALAGNNVQNWNGNFIFTGSNTLNLGTGAITLGDNVTATVGNTLTIGGVIGDGTATFSLTKDGAGALTLNGSNTFDGGVTLTAGTLNIGHANALGSGTLTLNGGTIDNTSGASLTLGANLAQSWNGSFTFTGTNNITTGSGAVTLGADSTITVTAGTLNVGGAINSGLSAFGIVKAGAGTLSLGGLNTYTGATTLNQGALIYTADQVLTATTNTLTLGSSAGSTAAFSLALSGASAYFGGAMLVQTSNITANVITIGAGEILSVGKAVTIGYNPAANSTTKLNITGASGSFKIGDVGSPTNSNFQLGNSVADSISNAATLDMSGLGTFIANLGTGTFRIGDPTNLNGGGLSANGSSLILATASTIIATTITSDSPTSAAVQSIKLGSGTNVLNATTITIGGASNRGTGTLDFNTITGTVNIRALNGSGRATMNVQNGNTGTGANLVGTVDFRGHNADLYLAILAVGGRSAATTASGTGTFSFDAGTLDATTVNIAARTGTTSTTGAVIGTVNIGANSTIGTVTMSTNSSTVSTTGDATAALNISGGTNSINILTMGVNTVSGATGNGSNTDATLTITGGATTVNTTFTMGAQNSALNAATTVNSALSTLNISAGSLTLGGSTNLTMGATTLDANNAATATISITGTGSLTVGGNIQYTNGLGTETNTVTLNGGTLDLTSGNIGASAALITFNAQAGTLRNLAELNGGGTLTKTTAGTLLLDTANSYTGSTVISAGVLVAANATALGTSAGATSVTSGAELRLQGGITIASEALTLNGTGIATAGALRNLSGNNSFGGAITLATASSITSAAGTLTLTGGVSSSTNQNLTISGAGNVTISTLALNLGTGTLTMNGSGTLLLSVANTFAGATINSGTVQIGNAGSLSGTITLVSGATLDLNGFAVSNTIVLAEGATLTGGSITASTAPTIGTVNTVLAGIGATLAKTDNGRLVLAGANTYTGATSIAGTGTIAVASFGDGGVSSSPLGFNALNDPDKLVIGSGTTLEFTGSSNLSTERSFTMATTAGVGGTIAATGIGALTFTESSIIKLTGTNPRLRLSAGNANAVNYFDATLDSSLGLDSPVIDTLIVDGVGQWVIGSSAINRFKNTASISVGAGTTLGFESGSLGDSTYSGSTIAVAGGAGLRWSGVNTDDISGRLVVPSNAAVKLDTGSNVVTFESSPVMAPGSSLSVIGGKLIINSTVGDVGVSTGATLGGDGTVGAVIMATGSHLSPGNSPGTINMANLTLAAGVIIDWQVQDAMDFTAPLGFDTIHITGNLDLSADYSVNRIKIGVISLLGTQDGKLGNGTTLGAPDNFNNADTVGMAPRIFNFMRIEGNVNKGSNSITDIFEFDLSEFQYSNGGSNNLGLWSISEYFDNVSGDTYIRITAVPEPSTYGLALGALALAAAAIRRRRKNQPKV